MLLNQSDEHPPEHGNGEAVHQSANDNQDGGNDDGAQTLEPKLTKEQSEELEEAGELSPPKSSVFNQMCLISALAIVGVYLRIVLMNGTPHGFVDYLTSQFIGSFALGFLFQVKAGLNPDIFTGISVGFCGSLTTFSTWQVDIVETLVGTPGAPSSAAGKTYVWFQDQVIGFSVPFAGLAFGKHTAEFFSIHVAIEVCSRRIKGSRKIEGIDAMVRLASILAVLCAIIGVIVGAVLVSSITSFSLIFAPAGALLRFSLSRYLNSINLRFFWGTFVANVLGSVVGGIIFGFSTLVTLSPLSCAALWAVEYGFCGALTTVSTYVNEIHTLPSVRDAYIYGTVSVLATQACLIIVMGGFVWTQSAAFSDPNVCFLAK
jgi:CrcB protein